MSVNIKINGQIVNDIHAVRFETDSVGTFITFPEPPSGNQDISTTDEYDVATKSTARISAAERAKIIPENIANGVTILGVSGSLEVSKLPQVVDRTVTVITADDLEGVTSIGWYAFYGCTELTSVTIPDGVTSIGNAAFRDCSNLTSVTIPGGVTSIGQSAFNNCPKLTSVTIPDSITSIRDTAFLNCSGLTSVTIEAEVPPTLANANALANTNSCPIYVPATSVNDYKSTTNWSALASRIQAIPT